MVTVTQPAASVEVSPSVYELTALGATVQLTAEALDGNGHGVAGAEFSWESSDVAVATVDASGLVTAVRGGNATITATYEENTAESVIGTAAVTVAQVVRSAPPEWVFTGDVSETLRTMFREEMEHSRAYFAHHHGVEATGFTVLVGADYASLEPVYREVAGAELSWSYLEWEDYSHAWVRDTPRGSAVVAFILGSGEFAYEIVNAVVHEYFHVLQGQLAAGMTPLGNGEFAWKFSEVDFPRWLGEGFASYSDYLYSETRPDRPRFLDDRYTPLKDLGTAISDGDLDLDDLPGRLVNNTTSICDLQNFTFYALSFMAAIYVGERSPDGAYVEFWKLLGERPTWQAAFSEAFGINPDDFNTGFQEWLRPQIPTWDYIDVAVRWPTKSTDPRIEGAAVSIDLENRTWEGTWRTSTSGGSIAEPPAVFRVYVPGGTVGTVELEAWWVEDQRTKHLLGWHKDGGLTTNVNELTPLRFTGAPSGKLEWMLPAHPGTLRRLCSAPIDRGCRP